MDEFTGKPSSMDGRTDTEIAIYDLLDSLGIEYETLCHNAAISDLSDKFVPKVEHEYRIVELKTE